MPSFRLSRGRCLPLGASAVPEGVNFALLCRHGTKVWLAIYPADSGEALAEFELHPRKNRTGDHWHVHVAGLPPTFRYGWRVDGPAGPGHRVNRTMELLDPGPTALPSGAVWGQYREPEESRTARRSLYVRRSFDWREDTPPLVPPEDSIVYELHVRGFTCHPSSFVAHPGTFAGLAEKI